jgi:hypothetical protein
VVEDALVGPTEGRTGFYLLLIELAELTGETKATNKFVPIEGKELQSVVRALAHEKTIVGGREVP